MTSRSPANDPPASGSAEGLRVLMLTPSYVPRAGGVEKHVRMVARRLAERGLQVRLATPRWEADWPEHETLDGLAVTRLNLRTGPGRKTLAPLVDWADIVHAHDAYPFLKHYLPHRFRCPRKPVFVTFHGYERYPIPLEARLLRRVVLWLTRGSICAGAFIPKWYGFRCPHVTHGGVDAPPERPPLGSGAVFVGRLEADTGFLTYLEALRLLKEVHGHSLPLEVLGDGSLRKQGETLASSCGLAVRFHGRVSEVMPHLVRARFAFVDGLLAMLEAMAAGTVVLSTYDNPLKRDYLLLSPGARHAVISESARDLAERLAALVERPEQQERMAAEAYGFARTQTWDKVADLYMALYQPFAAGGRP